MTQQPPQPPDGPEVDVGLYVHVAFCQSICYYCDFNTYAGLSPLIPRYVAALAEEIAALPTRLPGEPPLPSPDLRVGSVFFGGGTPSLLAPAQVAAVLASARRWPIAKDAEVTLEANPGDLSVDRLRALREAGVNRLSLGVQSFDDRMLRRLGRRHDAATARRAFRQAREAGFANLSIDLMFGLPEQSLDHWRGTLDRALALKPDHLSLYNLTIESGTPFGTWSASGKLTVPDDDAAADMYQAAIDRLGAEGYRQYEISNWARVDQIDYRAQHNLRYWRNQPYFGVGAGAHSSFGGYRYANLRRPLEYVKRVEAGESPVDSLETIDPTLAMAETMILGLRLDEGVDVDGFGARFGRGPGDVFPGQLTELTDLGLLAIEGRQIRLTLRGRFLGNEVFCRFL
ncbi:MAG: radical SAM family heme chaperone HemW [Chloroflexota bacterium]